MYCMKVIVVTRLVIFYHFPLFGFVCNDSAQLYRVRVITGTEAVKACDGPDNTAPLLHGTRVSPSGRFPSALLRFGSSSSQGMSTRLAACFMMELHDWCRGWRPAAYTSTGLPQMHQCAWEIKAPILRATATLSSLLSSLRPGVAERAARNQSATQ